MDPRVDRTRQHVLACARELLLAEGAAAVTFSAVGRRARVSRNTLYRHWATSEQLLVDVTLQYYLDEPGAEAGGPQAPAPSVAAFLYAVRDSLRTPGTLAVLGALVAQAERDATSAEVLRQVAQLRQRALSAATGPLTDAQFAALVGPVFYQALIARRPLDDAFLDELISGLDRHLPTAR